MNGESPILVPVEPRELTSGGIEERRETCRGLDQQIKASIRQSHEALWDLAKALDEFDGHSGWSMLGFRTLTKWLAEPEVGLSYDQYHRLVSVYRETTLRGADLATLQGLDVAKVQIVLPAVKAGRARLPAALEDVQVMSARDLRAAYCEPKPALPQAADRPTLAGSNGSPNVGTTEPTPPPQNPTDDKPVLASEAPVGFDLDLEPQEPDEEPVEEPFEVETAVATVTAPWTPRTPEKAAEAPLTLAEMIEEARDSRVMLRGRRHHLEAALLAIIAAYDRERAAR